MKNDIEIAQAARLQPIREIAASLGINDPEIEAYGQYKAKLNEELRKRLQERPDGKLVLVTATSPTPMGEGKSTTMIGLGQALGRLGQKTVIAIREPSLGPVFGIKGGAAGGGQAQVVPMEDINLHFTGDMHAITAANNLLSALIDNHLQQGNALGLDPRRISWKRCLDMNDRALRQVTVGLGGPANGVPREDGFNITVASEVMAILCLAENMADLKERLGRIIIGYNFQKEPVRARELKAAGAMAALLKDAIKPNLVQTLENTPAIMHGGPFANIAHGCNSVLATRLALKLADITVTEAGFGADLGAEKFFNIKCRLAGLKPDAAVLVTTLRSLRYNGGAEKTEVNKADLDAIKKGVVNLARHLANLQAFGVPVVVALNNFDTDSPAEIEYLRSFVAEEGADFALSRVWAEGGAGGEELAQALIKTLKEKKSDFQPLYDTDWDIKTKIKTIAQKIYDAREVKYSALAEKQIMELERIKQDRLPICMAKTQYSFSDDPAKLGAPKNFDITVRELRLSAGAGFIIAILGDIMTMPGLPKTPAAENIDIDENGRISGLF